MTIIKETMEAGTTRLVVETTDAKVEQCNRGKNQYALSGKNRSNAAEGGAAINSCYIYCTGEQTIQQRGVQQRVSMLNAVKHCNTGLHSIWLSTANAV